MAEAVEGRLTIVEGMNGLSMSVTSRSIAESMRRVMSQRPGPSVIIAEVTVTRLAALPVVCGHCLAVCRGTFSCRLR